MPKSLAPVLLLSSCLMSCTMNSKDGRDFDASKVSQIVEGKTTQDDIRRMFGKPMVKVPYGAARDGMRWGYYYGRVPVKAHAVPANMVGPVSGYLPPNVPEPKFIPPEPDYFFSAATCPRKNLTVTFDAHHVVLSHEYGPGLQSSNSPSRSSGRSEVKRIR